MEHSTTTTVINSHAIDVAIFDGPLSVEIKSNDVYTMIMATVPNADDISMITAMVRRHIPRVDRAHFRGLVMCSGNDNVYTILCRELDGVVMDTISNDIENGKKPDRNVRTTAPMSRRSSRNDADHIVSTEAQINDDAALAAQLQADSERANELQTEQAAALAQIDADEELARRMSEDPAFEPDLFIEPAAPAGQNTTTTPGDLLPNSRFSADHNDQYIIDALREYGDVAHRDPAVSAKILRESLVKFQAVLRRNNALCIPAITDGNYQKLFNVVTTAIGGQRADRWAVGQIVNILIYEQY